MTKNFFEPSLEAHYDKGGKWEISPKMELNNRRDLSLAYTPGVAAVSEKIKDFPDEVYSLTMKGNSVAIISDGSAVLGLGNIGAEASLPVMEGKAILFKKFANIDGIPIVIGNQDTQQIIDTIVNIAPTFGGINLEDIGAPKCFEIEEALQDLGIPVFHDDQHGTAIVLLAALINACKVTQKNFQDLKVVINGAGAAGIAIAKLLCGVGLAKGSFPTVKELTICDSRGIISNQRNDLNSSKLDLLTFTNPSNISGQLKDAMKGADVFVGVSIGGLLNRSHIESMAPHPLVFPMANPTPEIMPDEAFEGGAAIVGTGRSDFPNQVNNVLAFPGIFRGALDARASKITEEAKLSAAIALANCVKEPNKDRILPDPLEEGIALEVGKAVYHTLKN